MTVDDVVSRLLSPTVVATMLVTGVAYGAFLWSLNIRGIRLWAGAMMPGALFLAVIWAIRSAQGVQAVMYLALLVDWTVFSATGALTVLAVRRIRRRRTT